LVGPDVIGRLVEGYLVTGKPVVASEYRGTLGVPALFAQRYFPQLSGLADGGGAKRVIAGAGNAVHAVPFLGGAFDIDTPQDYERLQAVEGRPAEGVPDDFGDPGDVSFATTAARRKRSRPQLDWLDVPHDPD
jgi:hypothetical protein